MLTVSVYSFRVSVCLSQVTFEVSYNHDRICCISLYAIAGTN